MRRALSNQNAGIVATPKTRLGMRNAASDRPKMDTTRCSSQKYSGGSNASLRNASAGMSLKETSAVRTEAYSSIQRELKPRCHQRNARPTSVSTTMIVHPECSPPIVSELDMTLLRDVKGSSAGGKS